jgi:hypothetical protein
MRLKKLFAVLVCSFVLCALSNAVPFSFQINQFDAARTDVSEASFLFEDIMLGYFFDAGYIVSNLPSVVIHDPNAIAESRAINEAREGLLDYIALVVLVYDRKAKQTSSDESKFAFTYASWKLYRVSDGKLISTGRITGSDFAGKDAETTLRNCARNLSRDLDTALKKI